MPTDFRYTIQTTNTELDNYVCITDIIISILYKMYVIIVSIILL